MEDKIKTSIVIDRRLWEEFKLKVSGEKGLKMLGSERKIPLTIVPVKPRVTTDAGKVVRELRDSRL